jgi:hypothetical protein
MFVYKILKPCYFAESKKNGCLFKARLYEKGAIYQSETLEPKDAPGYFELQSSAPSKTEKQIEEQTPRLNMNYNEMQKFVKEKDIEVADMKKETLIDAIMSFYKKEQMKGDEETKAKKEAKEEALKMGLTPSEKPVQDDLSGQKADNKDYDK